MTLPIYLELFVTFFKIGLFTFGGGYAMLPLIQKEVLAHDWMELEEVINFIAVSESTPGPFAINCATYVGIETGGILGAVCATLGVVMPSFIVILCVARFYKKFKESKIVSSVMTGLRPAVIGLIGSAAILSAVALPLVTLFGYKISLGACSIICSFSGSSHGQRLFSSLSAATDAMLAALTLSATLYILELSCL